MASHKIIISKEEITKVIPQRDPFVMIDDLIEVSENTAKTQLRISPDNIFCREGLFIEPGIIENIAQTAATKAGYESMIKNKKAPVGFIGAVKNLEIYRLPEEGELLLTEIVIESKIMNVFLVKGRSYVENEAVAECEMKIFEKPEE
jgi:predicted hotdog family 3-hydroxylacyl-ACP dehydratase